MTIEPNMLDVETVSLAGQNTTPAPPRTVIITRNIPGTPALIFTNGIGEVAPYIPEVAGQLIFYNSSSGNKLYCAVLLDSTLTWVPCSASLEKYDLRTGKRYDPNLAFYSPLAK